MNVMEELNIRMRLLANEDVSDSEIKRMNLNSARQELVKVLFMDKMKSTGNEMVDFDFTPGDSFEDTAIIDVVNCLVDIHIKAMKGDLISNPPVTDVEKKTLLGD